MLGYIIAFIGLFIIIIALVMLLRGVGGNPTTDQPRPDEQKGRSYSEPQAEQLHSAESQTHGSSSAARAEAKGTS